MSKFTDQMDAWVLKSKARTEAVFKQSAQFAAEEAQQPIAKGGRMPVDTGYLRNSFGADIGRTPSGRLMSGTDNYSFNAVEAAIVRARVGEAIIFGWAANYAPYMEARYAFARSVIQNWDQIVLRAIDQVKRGYR